MDHLTRFARRAPFAAFVAITCVFMWSLVLLAPRSIGVSLLALFGPAVGGVLVTLALGEDAWGAFLTRSFAWRCRVRWYLIACALPVLVTLLRSGVEYALGARGPIAFQSISALSLVVFVLVVGEEIGWRGFALPLLRQRGGPWRASVIIGVVWAAWHLPLFYLEGMPQHGTPIVPFVAYCVGLSLVLTFLAGETRGSVVIATLFHGVVNTVGVVNTAATPAQRGWANAASYALAGVAIGILAWRSRASTAAR